MNSALRFLRLAPARQSFAHNTRSYSQYSPRARRATSLKHISSPPLFSLRFIRFNSSLVAPKDGVLDTTPRPLVPSYQLTFTCKPCKNRSAHIITKHGYHKGTVLIKCPSCANRHVISDHLKIFMDEKSTLEDILARKAGEEGDITRLLKKGKLGMRQGEMIGREGDEDIEFWEDGSETSHTPAHSEKKATDP